MIGGMETSKGAKDNFVVAIWTVMQVIGWLGLELQKRPKIQT